MVTVHGAIFQGKIFPGGRFSLGYCRPKKVSDKERTFDRLHKSQYTVHKYQERTYRGLEDRSITEWHDTDELYKELLDNEITGGHMGLSTVVNSHKSKTTRKRRGLKGISAFMKNCLRSGAWLLEKRFGRKRLAMLTATLPAELPISPEGFAEIQRQFIQELGRELKRKDGSGHLVGCVEIQEKRFKRTNEVVPHLHIIFESHAGNYNYYLSKNFIRNLWERVVGNVVGQDYADQMRESEASTRIEAIKKSAANYLGKYLSKGATVCAAAIEAGKEDKLPLNWSVLTNRLRKAIRKSIIPVGKKLKEDIISGIDLVAARVLKWIHKIETKFDDREFTIGWCGEVMSYKLKYNIRELLE